MSVRMPVAPPGVRALLAELSVTVLRVEDTTHP
jgi:hypothetical protein